MLRPFGFISLILFSGLLATGAPGGPPEPEPKTCAIPLTGVLRIPVNTLGPQDSVESPNPASNTLTISQGAPDEPPEGPDGFDVLDDGSLLITDPLRGQISSFDSTGKFRKVWKIGFAADSLTAIPSGMVLVREASTGRLYAFDREGNVRQTESPALPERAEARVLLGKNRGSVMRPTIGDAGGGPLEVRFDKPGSTLLSLESLATDARGDSYVALEATTSGAIYDEIDLNKYVRRYSPDGRLLGEIAGIPLDYYVNPVDELRVHDGLLYQLQTTKSEVRINVWNMNQPCSAPSAGKAN